MQRWCCIVCFLTYYSFPLGDGGHCIITEQKLYQNRTLLESNEGVSFCKSKFYFIGTIIRCLLTFITCKKRTKQTSINFMLKNYLKTALRNLSRNKGYAAINVSGLAVGMAACILLFIVVRYELSYDKFQPDYQNIYRVVTQDKYSDGLSYTPGTPFPVLDALRVDIPQITSGVLYSSNGSQV